VSSERTFEDLVDGDGGVVDARFLEEEDLEAVRCESFFEEGDECGGDGVGVDFLQVEAVLELDVAAADGDFVAFAGGCVGCAPGVRVGGRFGSRGECAP